MKKITVKTSKIEGSGIYIEEDAVAGDVISNIKGEPQFKINKNKRDALSHPNWVGVAENQWIDPAIPYKFLNHSCNPNSGIKGRLSIVALRNIEKGEEITVDYSTIEGDPRWEMRCSCGENNCRKIIYSIHSLPKSQFAKYLPYVSTYFKKLYLKEQKQLEPANN